MSRNVRNGAGRQMQRVALMALTVEKGDKVAGLWNRFEILT